MSRTAKPSKAGANTSRRAFIKDSSLFVAGSAVTGQLPFVRSAHAFGSDEIRIGLIGCGDQGTRTANHALCTEGLTRLVAMGDIFPDRLQASLRGTKSQHRDRVDVPPERRFVGFDAYARVLEADVDLVILATPPGFRPLHFDAAVKARKHVFMEAPVAVDAVGVRRVLESAETARQHGLAVMVGLHRRHEQRSQETIKRLHDAAVGDIIFSRAFGNTNCPGIRARQDRQTEMSFQLRNWRYFNWLCGDHIVEQQVHHLDVINWLTDALPVSAQGQGWRQARSGAELGETSDHHMLEFTYADNSRLLSQCRQRDRTWSNTSEHSHGTRGSADISTGIIRDRRGANIWSYGRGRSTGQQQQQQDLFSMLRKGERPNECQYAALATMTSLLGRMASYSGQIVKWDDAIHSEQSLANVDAITSLEDIPPVLPDQDGRYAIPVPGPSTDVLA